MPIIHYNGIRWINSPHQRVMLVPDNDLPLMVNPKSRKDFKKTRTDLIWDELMNNKSELLSGWTTTSPIIKNIFKVLNCTYDHVRARYVFMKLEKRGLIKSERPNESAMPIICKFKKYYNHAVIWSFQ